jgi:hypothetical protein
VGGGSALDNPDDPTYILNVALPTDNAAKFIFSVAIKHKQVPEANKKPSCADYITVTKTVNGLYIFLYLTVK